MRVGKSKESKQLACLLVWRTDDKAYKSKTPKGTGSRKSLEKLSQVRESERLLAQGIGSNLELGR